MEPEWNLCKRCGIRRTPKPLCWACWAKERKGSRQTPTVRGILEVSKHPQEPPKIPKPSNPDPSSRALAAPLLGQRCIHASDWTMCPACTDAADYDGGIVGGRLG